MTNRILIHGLIVASVVLSRPCRSFAEDDAALSPAELASAAREVMKTYCYRCHKGEGSKGGDFDVLSSSSLLVKLKDSDDTPVVKGKSADSLIYRRLTDKEEPMPPKNIKERPAAAEIEIIKKWIDAGAPEPAAAARKPVTLLQTLTTIHDDLKKADKEDRPYLRYFTLTHLHNLPSVAESDLRTYRAALSKAINSLSWKKKIVLPRAVDKEQTVFAIDMRDLDWDLGDRWTHIMAAYPYGLRFNHHQDLRQVDEDIVELTGCDMPMVRADWFVATATRPPLYHQLLNIPHDATTLERQLGVDIEANFRRDRLARGGVFPSGVSKQNRILERHEATTGAYWKSYDFLPDHDKADMKKVPLGPQFRNNPYPDQAFQHDGGEIIFNLPNGLQAYMLVDGKDQRIDAGPTKVVGDALQTSGTTEIVNGVSCMACHKHGMIDFKDQVLEGTAVFGPARRKVERLYSTHDKMAAWLKDDRQRFMAALEQAAGPFLRSESDKGRKLEDYAEPISQSAVLYTNSGVDVATVAVELGLEKAEQFLIEIGKKRLEELGLGPLARGGKIDRRQWETGQGLTLFQQVAREFRYTPWKYVAN